MRRVRQVDSVPDEKGLIILNGSIDKVIDWLHRLAPNVQPLIAVSSTTQFVSMGHGVGETMILRIAFPPLAGL
jgi:hypothetical protein